MSTIDTTSPEIAAGERFDRAPVDRVDAVGAVGQGRVGALIAALTSADHKVVGGLFVGASTLVLLATAAVGALLGAARIDGDGDLLDAGALPQLFAAHRVSLVFGVLAPLLLGVAVAVVPLQVGARALAFPRVAAFGFWAWASGLVLVVIALCNNGGPGGGDADMVDLFLAAHGLVVIGLAAAAGSVAATVLTTRAPGLRLRRLPLFTWSAMVASIGLLLMLPVLLGVLIYLFVDHRNARAAFGGNVGVGSWIAFAYTQPATYLFAVPAFGLFAELVPVTFRRRMPLRGVVYAGLTLIAVAALSAVTQQPGHAVPWAGSGLDLHGLGDKIGDLVVYALFTLLPLLGVLVVLGVAAFAAKPSGDGVRPSVTAPFVFAFFGVGMVIVGMLGGALTPITDLGLRGTVFEEGALVYVAYGTALAGLGAVVWWAPKVLGRRVPERPALGLAGLGLVATILATLPYYAAGFADQPAAEARYDIGGPSALFNLAVTAGHALMALVVLAFLGLVVSGSRSSAGTVEADPWQGHTLEWTTSSPAPRDNFAETPTVISPEPALDLRATPGDGY